MKITPVKFTNFAAGVFLSGVVWPILTDQAALVCTLGAVLLYDLGFGWVALFVCLVGATARETVPLWAALAVGSPLLLLALIAPVVRFLFVRDGKPFYNSLKTARSKQASRLPFARFVLLPWGVCLAGMCVDDWRVWLSLAVGYALLLVVNDTVRVYQAACLPVIAATVAVVPHEWAVPLAVAHLFNPWRGEYVQNA